jgi:hypothetical protein
VIIVVISFNGLRVNLTLDFDYIPSFWELVTIMNLIIFISSWSNHVCFPLFCSCLFSFGLFVFIFSWLCSSSPSLFVFIPSSPNVTLLLHPLHLDRVFSLSVYLCLPFPSSFGVYYCNKPPLFPPLYFVVVWCNLGTTFFLQMIKPFALPWLHLC